MAGEVGAAVDELLPDLLATATALTGDAQAAADLLGEVIVASRRRGERIEAADPGPGLRNLLVARYLVHRPSRAAAGADLVDVPAAEPLEPDSDPPDELAPVLRDLDRLTRPQRAALLLSFRDRLTYAEIAGIFDRPVAKVSQAVAEAQTALDATPYAIAAAFDRLGRAAPDPADARAAAVRFGRRQGARRRRLTVLVSAAVVVLALAVALPTVILPRLFPIPVRASGEWAYGYNLKPPAGFHVTQRFLERDQDSSYLLDEAHPDTGCGIKVSVAGPTPTVEPGRRSVKVNGRPGWYSPAEERGDTQLTWLYAPQATATVSCDAVADAEELMLDLARSITFTPVPLSLPFRLDQLPEGYEVQAVGTASQLPPGDPSPVSGLLLAPAGTTDATADTIFLIMPGDRPEGRNPHTEKVNGTDAVLQTEDGDISLCLPVQQSLACLSGAAESSKSRSVHDPDVRRLLDLAKSLSFAPDLNDKATWFDARDALPH